MRLLINYDVQGWAYHNRALALQDCAPGDFEVTIASHAERDVIRKKYDVVFQLDYSIVVGGGRRKTGDPPLVVSFNSDENRRFDMYKALRSHCEFVVFNNHGRWVFEGRPPRTCNISNGVDTKLFRVVRPMRARPRRLIWCGSTGPNKPKGWKEVIAPLEAMAQRHGYECSFRPVNSVEGAMSRDEMVEWYNRGAVILCASASDATPNTTLEGMACGCVPVSTWIGNIREFGVPGENCIIVPERDPKAFLDAVAVALENREALSREARLTMERWDWSVRAKYFYALFRRLVEGGPDSVEPFTHLEKPWTEV